MTGNPHCGTNTNAGRRLKEKANSLQHFLFSSPARKIHGSMNDRSLFYFPHFFPTPNIVRQSASCYLLLLSCCLLFRDTLTPLATNDFLQWMTSPTFGILRSSLPKTLDVFTVLSACQLKTVYNSTLNCKQTNKKKI